MLNKFLFGLIVFMAVGWWAEEHVDFERIKLDMMDTMSKEKTINTINSSRELRQEEINDITSGKYNSGKKKRKKR